MDQETLLRSQGYILEHNMLDSLTGLLEHYERKKEHGNNAFPAELESLMRDAENCLSASRVPKRGAGLQWSDVLSMGRPAGMDREEIQGLSADISAMLASALASGRNCFAIRYSSWGTPAFSIALEGHTSADTEGIVRSVCGHAQLRPSLAEEPGVGACRAAAECRMIFSDTDGREQKLFREKTENWVDRVASALPGKKYAVELCFQPVEEKWLQTQLDEAEQLCGWLEAYGELSWQVSGNVGNGTNKTDSILTEAGRTILGTERDNASYGMSASMTRTLHRNDARRLAEQLGYYCARLNEMLRGGACAVSISVNAENTASLTVIQAVLAGSLGRNGIGLRWMPDNVDTASLLLPVHALDLLVCFPGCEFPGFSILETEEYDLNPGIPEEEGVTAGNLLWRETVLPQKAVIPYRELNRHAFICGMTGAGKSNTVCHLLTAMQMPFLVIEPVKGEYRSLCGSLGRRTECFTVDVGRQDRLPVNPLWFPMGSSLQYHIDSIRTIISSAFDLYAAMPNILEQCLLRTYVNAGWNLVTSRNIYEGKIAEDRLYPTISDLCHEIELYLNASDFEGEAKGNYKGALLSRLQSFTSGAKGILLDEPVHMPLEKWLKDGVNVIIELDALADDADKCIVMGTILTQYFQYLKYCTASNAQDGLKHILVLEEAHHLFAEDSTAEDGSSAKKQLVASLSNLLAEIRAYGEGVLIIDQSPSRISPEVIKNTAVKIIHRVDYGKDIEMLQSALLLREGDRTVSRLRQGQALLRCGAMKKPAMIQVPCCEAKEKFTMNRQLSPEADEQCLVHSIMDTILLSESLRIELAQAGELFVNQALYDELIGIRKAMYLLWAQVQRLLSQHGFQELIRSGGRKPLLERLTLYGMKQAVKELFPEQKYLCEVIMMYLERLTVLETGSVRMGEKEWRILKDFRKIQVHARLLEFYTCSHDPGLANLRALCGAVEYLGILRCMVKELSGLSEQFSAASQSELPAVEAEKQARKLIREKIKYCFYVEPDSGILEMIESKLLYYFYKKSEISYV